MNQNENLTLILDTEEWTQELKVLPHHKKLFYLFYRFCKVLNSGIGYRRALIGTWRFETNLSFYKTSCYWTDCFLDS
ncbi:unnamed protein product [Rhizophagus irregularis]|nr:unnamed protein product [Rhizophagus irregularis]